MSYITNRSVIRCPKNYLKIIAVKNPRVKVRSIIVKANREIKCYISFPSKIKKYRKMMQLTFYIMKHPIHKLQDEY